MDFSVAFLLRRSIGQQRHEQHAHVLRPHLRERALLTQPLLSCFLLLFSRVVHRDSLALHTVDRHRLLAKCTGCHRRDPLAGRWALLVHSTSVPALLGLQDKDALPSRKVHRCQAQVSNVHRLGCQRHSREVISNLNVRPSLSRVVLTHLQPMTKIRKHLPRGRAGKPMPSQ